MEKIYQICDHIKHIGLTRQSIKDWQDKFSVVSGDTIVSKNSKCNRKYKALFQKLSLL